MNEPKPDPVILVSENRKFTLGKNVVYWKWLDQNNHSKGVNLIAALPECNSTNIEIEQNTREITGYTNTNFDINLTIGQYRNLPADVKFLFQPKYKN